MLYSLKVSTIGAGFMTGYDESQNDREEPGRGKRFVKGAALAINLGWTFMATVLGGFFGGYLLDRWLGTTPAFILILSFFGIAAAVYLVIREIPRLIR
jgi:F0F1-type ATP synthase assembly protein I